MPFWPFKKRRRNSAKDAQSQPLSEKAQASSTQQASEISRKTSKRGGQRKRPASQEGRPPEDIEKKALEAGTAHKENRPPPLRRQTSIENDITALPMSRKLDHSPHLRPVEMERPAISYKFRPFSSSQTSLQRQEATASPHRPNTLRSRRSAYDNATPQRRRSSKKRKDDHLREEEIRAMSAPIPIPKRPGDGPLRRDSKKMRGTGAKESVVSLPHGESIHSTMSGLEQRGWEIGMFDVFNPRPAVRLSGTPQYVAPNSVPNGAYSSSLSTPSNDKQKRPETKDTARKRETIGNRADDFDASDLRMLLERDAKRREKRKKAQQEKLDQKLRSRGGRNRADSDRRRHEREAEEERRADEARRRAEYEATERQLTMPPADIHPALRDQPTDSKNESVGLGIAGSQTAAGAVSSDRDKEMEEIEHLEASRNPFSDDAAHQPPTPKSEDLPAIPGAFETGTETPAEEPVVDTARAVRYSQASTPPLSPVHSGRGTPSISQVIDSRRGSELPPPPPITENRRASDPKPDRKTGTWAAFFRRGGTFARRQQDDNLSPSEGSFSNTSRESMRNQPLPAHLVGTQAPPVSKPRSKSGTPVRTQSKFREDLPELPISPPDSPMPSGDVMAAATAAAARRSGKSQPVDIPGSRPANGQGAPRNDTPMSPVRGHGLMSASLASVDSEGSWLASGGSAKRRSTQSALSRSLSQRKEFNASYEELGGDKDAEYLRKNTPSPDSKRVLRGHSFSGPAMTGASPDEESELNFDASQEAQAEAPAVHGSVRRKPTLVTRDPRVRSREGLLSEYTAESGVVETPPPTSDASPIDFDPEAPAPELKSASSVDYGKTGRGHARQMSAGSAKLLDVKRQSTQTPRQSTDV